MNNYEFYSQILQEDAEYWVVAKEVNSRQFFETKREKDDILFISLPHEITTGQKLEDIKYTDLEKIKHMDIPCNVFLSNNYSPFQVGQTFYNIYRGFPVKNKIKEFFLEAQKLNSPDLWDYEKLYKEINN